MNADDLSLSARKALARLLLNEQRGIRTHRTAIHQSTREALIRRGLLESLTVRKWGVESSHLRLTDEGIAAAHRVGVL